MLVVTLGTQSSGSTWIFNVVRALMESAGRRFHSTAADDGMVMLDGMPLDVQHVVLKCHSMDQRLIRMLRMAGGKLIVSTRDPRDSVVSLIDRFHMSARAAVLDLSKSYATLAVLPPDMVQLSLVYEDRFFDQERTVLRLADLLELPISSEQASDIFATFRPDVVRAGIERRLSDLPADADPYHDPITHWHPGHIGDGLSGKWRERLDERTARLIDDGLGPLAAGAAWQHRPLCWRPGLFDLTARHEIGSAVELHCDGTTKCLAFGPYAYLPPGLWRASPVVECVSRWRDVCLNADAFLPDAGHKQVGSRKASVRRGQATDLAITFRHEDHLQPVELRLHSTSGSRGRVSFSGWDLRWLGDA